MMQVTGPGEAFPASCMGAVQPEDSEELSAALLDVSVVPDFEAWGTQQEDAIQFNASTCGTPFFAAPRVAPLMYIETALDVRRTFCDHTIEACQPDAVLHWIMNRVSASWCLDARPVSAVSCSLHHVGFQRMGEDAAATPLGSGVKRLGRGVII